MQDIKVVNMDTIRHLIDECRGIYIPQAFYEGFDFGTWNLNINDYKELRDPTIDDYWDTWDDLIEHAEYHDDDGYIWTLHQDGGLYAIRNDHQWEQECLAEE